MPLGAASLLGVVVFFVAYLVVLIFGVGTPVQIREQVVIRIVIPMKGKGLVEGCGPNIGLQHQSMNSVHSLLAIPIKGDIVMP